MTLDHDANKKARQAQVNDMIGEAKRISSAIFSARTPEEARGLLSQLVQLSSSPAAMASSSARMVVTSCISVGERICDYLQEVAAMEALGQITQARYEFHKERDALASMLDSKLLFGQNERKWIESINPNEQRLIAVLDRDGVKRGEALIDGQRLRDSAAIVAAYSEYDKIKADPAALARYNMLVYGKESGPANDEERRRGEQRVREAILDVEGDAAKRATSSQAAERAGERARTNIARVERAEDLERRRHSAPPGLERAAGQAAVEARLEARRALRNSRRERYGDQPAQPQAQGIATSATQQAVVAAPEPRAPAAPAPAQMGQLPPPSFTQPLPSAPVIRTAG